MEENLREEACQVRREYLREWRKRNPERVREANRRYWERKAKLKRKKEVARMNSKPFLKIREAAAVTGLSEYFLRQGCRNGSIDCLRSGQVYFINMPRLMKNFGIGKGEVED